MSFSGDQWGRPQPSTPPDQPNKEQLRRGLRGVRWYFVMVAFFAVITVISFAASAHSSSHLMAWLFLTLTVLVAIVPLLIHNIARAGKRRQE